MKYCNNLSNKMIYSKILDFGNFFIMAAFYVAGPLKFIRFTNKFVSVGDCFCKYFSNKLIKANGNKFWYVLAFSQLTK